MTEKKTKQDLRDELRDRPAGSQHSASAKPAPPPKKVKGGDK